MKPPFKMWASTDEEARKILDYMYSIGGHWPATRTETRFDVANGGYYIDSDYCMTYTSRGNRDYYNKSEYEEFKFATPVKQDEDGWFINDGKHEQPMADDVIVDVKFRGGSVSYGDRADTWWWAFDEDAWSEDILTWRYHDKNTIAPLSSEKDVEISDKPTTSDGLSTVYYKLKITNEDGESIECEMGDVIRCVVGDNFSLGNIYKACRRMYEASQGRGKQDVSIEYDANKVSYFSHEFAKFYKDKK